MSIPISSPWVGSLNNLAPLPIADGVHRPGNPNPGQPPSVIGQPLPALPNPVERPLSSEELVERVLAQLIALAPSLPQNILQHLAQSIDGTGHVETRLLRLLITLNTNLMQRTTVDDIWASDLWPRTRPTQRFWGTAVLEGYVQSYNQAGTMDVVDRSYASYLA